MRLIAATNKLAGYDGSETYLTTVVSALQWLGHDVVIHAPEQGPLAAVAREQGLQVAAGEHELPERPDAILSQAGDAAFELAGRYPGVGQVFVVHAVGMGISQPPQAQAPIRALVALNGLTFRHASAMALDCPVARLRQPIDTSRFTPAGAAAQRPRRGLSLGNWVTGARRDLLEQACERAGIELRVAGKLSEPLAQPEREMWDADIVFGRGRVILEAMACGRAAYVLDASGAGGFVTPERYAELEDENFSGILTARPLDADALAADLGRYTPEMGLANRDLALTHHTARRHARELVELLEQAAGGKPAPPGPWRELARVTRVSWEAQLRSLALVREVETLHRRRLALEAERDELHQRLGRAETLDERAREIDGRARELAIWESEVEERLRLAKDVEADAIAFRQTRRYRLARALARPVDRLRRR